MNKMLGLGKLVTVGFWLMVVISLFGVFVSPFNTIIPVAGLAIVFILGIEAVLWRRALMASGELGKNVVMVLIFGVFHMATLQLQTGNARQSAN
ncbi:DUF1145 domain-containing protein [Spongorhabdus nitratireducens]